MADAPLVWFAVELFDGVTRVFSKELQEENTTTAARKIFMYADRVGFDVSRVNIARVERKSGTIGATWETFNIERSPCGVQLERAVCPHCAHPIEDRWRVCRLSGVAVCTKCTTGRSRRRKRHRSHS